jgi:hypothetical protein
MSISSGAYCRARPAQLLDMSQLAIRPSFCDPIAGMCEGRGRPGGHDAALAPCFWYHDHRERAEHLPRPGRVALIVFVTGRGEVVFGMTSLLALFESVGSLGEAKGPVAHVEAIAVTALVLAVATTVMSAWLFLRIWLVRVAVA